MKKQTYILRRGHAFYLHDLPDKTYDVVVCIEWIHRRLHTAPEHIQLTASPLLFKGSKRVRLKYADKLNTVLVLANEAINYIGNDSQRLLKQLGCTKQVYLKIEPYFPTSKQTT